MHIDIYSDVACPWCYLGKRRLEQALERFDEDVTVRWRPFQLDPSAPTEPTPLQPALAAKFGGLDRVRPMNDQLTELGRAAGLDYRFADAQHVNTFPAHRLAWYAEREGYGIAVADGLFRAYFTEGRNVADPAVLLEVGVAAGLEREALSAFLDSEEGNAEVAAELAEAQQLGITGVPTYVLAGKYAVSGAQEPDTLLEVLDEVRRRESATTPLTTLGDTSDTQAGTCTDDSCAL
ncbi:DSBA oxidoreductase [Actinocatenispora thailandica]|uniref:DSBA oxidoreductase n=1 Tax=Actinocatenispora thailandica TaxID=227318 RepID=A0A7R7DW54_9ACTN|nr:DsbA family oxidoreductase [Actinocatenispora thailandica]BCJ38844.1 DSBA oxidoreductase [Actinocatenispora thailandica]